MTDERDIFVGGLFLPIVIETFFYGALIVIFVPLSRSYALHSTYGQYIRRCLLMCRPHSDWNTLARAPIFYHLVSLTNRPLSFPLISLAHANMFDFLGIAVVKRPN